MTFNQIYENQILYSDEENKGLINHKNQLKNSTWTVLLDDVFIDGFSIFNTYHKVNRTKKSCQASIATASNYIKLPIGDF